MLIQSKITGKARPAVRRNKKTLKGGPSNRGPFKRSSIPANPTHDVDTACFASSTEPDGPLTWENQPPGWGAAARYYHLFLLRSGWSYIAGRDRMFHALSSPRRRHFVSFDSCFLSSSSKSSFTRFPPFPWFARPQQSTLFRSRTAVRFVDIAS